MLASSRQHVRTLSLSSSVCKQTHKLLVSAKITLIGVGNLSHGLRGVKQLLIHLQTFDVISDPKPPLF